MEYIDTSKKYRIRRSGDILLDIEPLLEELCDDHDLQHYEILSLVKGWLEVHRPENKEQHVNEG